MNRPVAAAKTLAPARARLAIRSALAVLAATGALAIAGRFRIYLPSSPVPITLQTFVVLLGAALLGPLRGAAVPALLWTGGAAGLPVFQGAAAGLAYALGPTGGYLLGWMLAAPLVGAFARGSPRVLAGAMIAGSALILAFGTLWLALVLRFSPVAALDAGFLPFLPGEVLKVSAAFLGALSFRAPIRRLLDDRG